MARNTGRNYVRKVHRRSTAISVGRRVTAPLCGTVSPVLWGETRYTEHDGAVTCGACRKLQPKEAS